MPIKFTRKPASRGRNIRQALQADGTLELLIYGDIGESFWDEGITAKSVKDRLDGAGIYSKLLVRINSPGGDAFEGLAIYNVLRAAKKPIEVCVDGIAASAASVIAMCGDVITMGPNTMMMIHEASGGCFGLAADMTKMAEILTKVSASIGQTYELRTKTPLDEVLALMAEETWMTAQECVDKGFANGISEQDEASQQAALAFARGFKLLGKMKNVPDKLKAEAEVQCECACENCQDGDCANCTNVDCEDPNCVDCPMQNTAAQSSDLSLYEARAKMLLRSSAA